MAYAPATSTSPNAPILALQPMAFGNNSSYNSTIGSTVIGGRIWIYQSTHLQTDVGASDFISDPQGIGMRRFDLVIANSLGTSGVSFHVVTTVASTFASLSAGLLISSAS